MTADIHIIKRLLSLVLVCALLVCIPAACGEDDKITDFTILRTAGIMGDPEEKAAYTQLLEGFSAAHPEIYFMGTVTEQGNAYKLEATFENTYEGANAPHIVYYYNDTGIEELCELFVSLDEIRKLYPDFAAGISDAALDCVRAEDGEVYCIPFGGEWTALAINNSLFATYGLRAPDSHSALLSLCDIFASYGIYPIANSPDDSAALFELIINSCGGISGDIFSADADSSGAWSYAAEYYNVLCGKGAFPAAAVNDDISARISDADITAAAQTDPIALFNSGRAAMLVLDSEDYSRITLDNFSVIAFPASDTAEQSLFTGGFRTGYYITRKAFETASVQKSAVEFVDYMTSQQAAALFCPLGYLPACTGEDNGTGGLFALAASAQNFTPDTRTAANTVRWHAAERIAALLSYKLITPAQAVKMVFDPQLSVDDIAPIESETVSDSDVVLPQDGTDQNAAQ